MKKILLLSLAILLGLAAFRTVNDYSAANVNQIQGMFIFADCKPVAPYDYLGTVKNAGSFGDANYEAVRDRLVKAAKKDFPNADGLILHLNRGGTDHADAIKFK